MVFLGQPATASKMSLPVRSFKHANYLMSNLIRQGRSIVLINNPSTWGEYPIATRASIERSLEHIGGLMNPDEDALFLVLSSHGSVDEHGEPIGELAVTNPR